jgi:hypothetical protein
VGGIPIAATVSIGLAHADDRPADIEALCERADKALYRAKALGRNRIESAVDELVPLVPDAPVEADVTPADLLIPQPKQARRAILSATGGEKRAGGPTPGRSATPQGVADLPIGARGGLRHHSAIANE